MIQDNLIRFAAVGVILLAFAQCEAPCTKTVSQSKINAVDQTKLAADVAAIDAYLDAEGIIAIEDPSGVRYTIEVEGSGNKPCIENTITVKYKGALLSNKTLFDNAITPVSFKLSNLILGWQIVLPQVSRGSKVTLYIPSGLGYGTNNVAGIPPNSNLYFEIELF